MSFRHWLDLLLPRRCAGCGAASEAALCDTCEGGLPWIPVAGHCDLCQDPVSGEPPTSTVRTVRTLCGRCAAGTSPLHACHAGVWLQGDVRDWIHRFKYPERGLAGLDGRAGAAVRQLTGAHRQDARWPAPPAVVPIPLHPRRLRARGFNPAGLLASEIARRNDVRTVFDWLVRLRDTPPQAGLGRRARHANVEGAFACRPLRGATPERIWLVDDVVTTGATLRAAARALCDAGVREVFALCAARTPSRGPRVDSEPGSS